MEELSWDTEVFKEMLSQDIDYKTLAMDLIGQLEESSYLFYQMLSSIPNSLMLLSLEGEVLAVSGLMAQKYMEKDRRQIVGETIQSLSFPVFYEHSQDVFIRKLLTEAKERGLEYENVLLEAKDKNKEAFYVEVSIKLLKDKKENNIGILLFFNEQVVRMNLLPKQQEREQLLQKMGSLSAGVIHEVKNPMQSISGIVQLMQMKYADDESMQKYLNMMMNEINNINILLSEFLGVSNKDKVEMCYGNVNEICQDVLRLVYGNCYMNDIRLVDHLSPSMPNMILDRKRFKQVIVNFLVNSLEAIKALKMNEQFKAEHPDYKGEITISTHYDYGLNECHIIIGDNGIGMNTSTIRNITKPFYTTKKYGTGIGVAISKDIISEHGGSLLVQSEVGKGSKFTIILPELAGLMQVVNAERRKNQDADSIVIHNSLDLIRDGFALLEKDIISKRRNLKKIAIKNGILRENK